MTSGLVFGFLLLAAGLAAGWLIPRFPEAWRKVPRDRYVGLLIGIFCVVQSLRMVNLLLEGSLEPLRHWLIPLGLFICLGAFFYLEYLFTRALGGFLLLMSNQVMHSAFVEHVPQRWFIAISCYLLGIVGIILITSPFRFRDLLRRIPDSSTWRWATALPLVIAGAGTCALFLMANHA